LVAIPIDTIIKHYEKSNISLYLVANNESDVLDNAFENIKSKSVILKSIEDVLMIGYPNGIWDSINNIPVIRKGIIATPSGIDYNGKKEFLIDMTVLPGSSGSPVIVYSETHTKKNGRLVSLARQYLLGVLSGPIEYPTSNNSASPTNVGRVIKASKILGFKKLLFSGK